MGRGSRLARLTNQLGSNGVRFSITCLGPPRARLLRCLYTERVGISLFDALASSADSCFAADVIEAVAQTVKRFLRIAEAYDVPVAHILVFATEAMRRAKNSADMLRSVHDATGLKVHVLDGTVETLFGAAGMRSAFADVRGLVLDLGGGSVQMTWLDSITGAGKAGEGEEEPFAHRDQDQVARISPVSAQLQSYEIAAARAGKSMPFGAARMTGLLESQDVAMVKQTENALHVQMRESFTTLTQEFPVLRRGITVSAESGREEDGIDVYLGGGGFRGYGNMLMHAESLRDVPYAIRSSIGSYKVTGKAFCKTAEMLKLHQETGDAIIPGLRKRRRRQFPAIVAVVDALVAAIYPAKIRSVTFCSGSNREGALFMMLPREIRESNPLPLLAPRRSVKELEVTESLARILRSAVPQHIIPRHTPTLLSLGLGILFLQSLWSRPGGDKQYNAAAILHEAVSRDEVAGMTHTARAVLALTAAARWEVIRARELGPAERQLLKGLKRIVGREAHFWCAFIGTVGLCISYFVPAWPKSPVGDIMR